MRSNVHTEIASYVWSCLVGRPPIANKRLRRSFPGGKQQVAEAYPPIIPLRQLTCHSECDSHYNSLCVSCKQPARVRVFGRNAAEHMIMMSTVSQKRFELDTAIDAVFSSKTVGSALADAQRAFEAHWHQTAQITPEPFVVVSP